MIPAITEKGGRYQVERRGAHDSAKKVFSIDLFCQKEMCRLRGFVRVSSSSNLTPQTRFLSRSSVLLSLRHPEFCCALEQLRPWLQREIH